MAEFAGRPTCGSGGDQFDGAVDFSDKSVGGTFAPLQVPTQRRLQFRESVGVDFNRLLATIAESGYLSTRLRPWDRLYFSGIQFLDAAGDFAAPLFFGGRVDGIVKAFQQRTGQGGASLGRQRQRLFEKLGNIGSHGRYFTPPGGDRKSKSPPCVCKERRHKDGAPSRVEMRERVG